MLENGYYSVNYQSFNDIFEIPTPGKSPEEISKEQELERAAEEEEEAQQQGMLSTIFGEFLKFEIWMI